jgi:hypothetical protein
MGLSKTCDKISLRDFRRSLINEKLGQSKYAKQVRPDHKFNYDLVDWETTTYSIRWLQEICGMAHLGSLPHIRKYSEDEAYDKIRNWLDVQPVEEIGL